MDQSILLGIVQRTPRHVVALVITAALIAGVLGVPAHGGAALQSTRQEIRCVAPEPGPFPSLEADHEQMPAASPVARPSASPIASPIASPVAEQIENGEDDIERLVRTIAVCQTQSRMKTFSRFVTEDFLSDMYAGGGGITREQFGELAAYLPNVPIEIISVTNIAIEPDGSATADVVSTYGRQLLRARWSFIFVQVDGRDATADDDILGTWWPDGVRPLPVEPPARARRIDLEIDEYEYNPDSLRVRGPDILLSADNRGDEDHEVLVLQLRHDVTTRHLLTEPGPALPNGVTVIGQLTVPAGTEGELILVGVEPGDYAIVDLLPNEDGTPHLALGMQASLTVR